MRHRIIKIHNMLAGPSKKCLSASEIKNAGPDMAIAVQIQLQHLLALRSYSYFCIYTMGLKGTGVVAVTKPLLQMSVSHRGV